jgi:hypothetical protein
MAETKTQAKKTSTKKRSASKAKAASKRKATGKRKATSKPKSASRPKVATSKPQAVLNTVEETAKDAGGAVGNAASKVGHVAGKAKVPLMAGGAALAGVAGGLAFGNRQSHRHNGLGGVSSKDLAKAAKKAGGAGLRVGELALEGRRAQQSSNGNGRTAHRSPVEVVLQGLTSRR